MKKISLFISVLFFTLYGHSQALNNKVAFTEDQSPIVNVNISPNPARNDFVVEVNSMDPAMAEIRFYNMLGEQLSVRAVKLDEGRNSFTYTDIDLFPGNYFVSVKTNEGSIVKKVTIE